jgi:hypothetical protein
MVGANARDVPASLMPGCRRHAGIPALTASTTGREAGAFGSRLTLEARN